jgi:hypothetical protein
MLLFKCGIFEFVPSTFCKQQFPAGVTVTLIAIEISSAVKASF